MIVCSCTGVTDRDIHNAIDWMLASDAKAAVTPSKIYRALGKAPRCGGCIRLFIDKMRSNEKVGVPAELQGLRPAARPRAAQAA